MTGEYNKGGYSKKTREAEKVVIEPGVPGQQEVIAQNTQPQVTVIQERGPIDIVDKKEDSRVADSKEDSYVTTFFNDYGWAVKGVGIVAISGLTIFIGYRAVQASKKWLAGVPAVKVDIPESGHDIEQSVAQISPPAASNLSPDSALPTAELHQRHHISTLAESKVDSVTGSRVIQAAGFINANPDVDAAQAQQVLRRVVESTPYTESAGSLVSQQSTTSYTVNAMGAVSLDAQPHES